MTPRTIMSYSIRSVNYEEPVDYWLGSGSFTSQSATFGFAPA